LLTIPTKGITKKEAFRGFLRSIGKQGGLNAGPLTQQPFPKKDGETARLLDVSKRNKQS